MFLPVSVNSLGYCDDGWVKAVSEQAGTIQHISNYYYNKVAGVTAEKLIKATGLSKVFFGNSGAEANECAIKFQENIHLINTVEVGTVLLLW